MSTPFDAPPHVSSPSPLGAPPPPTSLLAPPAPPVRPHSPVPIAASSPTSARAWPHRPLWLLPGVLALAFLTDALIRSDSVGAAVPGVAVGTASLVVALRRDRCRSATALLGLTAAASSVAAARQSPVVVTLAVVASVGLVVLAAGGVTDPGFRWSALPTRGLRNMVDGPRWLLRPRRPPVPGRRRLLARAMLIAGASAGLVTLALVTADPVFATIIGGAIPTTPFVRALRFLVVATPFTALALLASSDTATAPSTPKPDELRVLGFEGVAALASVAVVLGAWCTTQVVVALGGATRILESAGLTRAEYARSGFFQLVVTTALVLGLVVLLDRLTAPTSQDRRFVAAAIVVSLETLLLVAATGRRLGLYTDAFGLTLSRVTAAWCLGWLALLVTGTAFGVARRRTGRAGALGPALGAPFVVTSAAVAIIAFGWWNPEARIVEVNVGRARAGADLDVDYLLSLSSDGLVALVDDPSPFMASNDRARVERAACAAPTSAPWWNWNVSRHQIEHRQGALGC